MEHYVRSILGGLDHGAIEAKTKISLTNLRRVDHKNLIKGNMYTNV